MKSIAKLCSACVILLTGASQAGQELIPVPEIPYGGSGVVMGEPMIFVDPAAYTGTLFTRVKYKDLDEMAPCAVTKIISVKDPCGDDGCCGPQCVCIQICVPTCACEEVSSRRDGDRIRYDYGKFAVDVRIKRGYIEVDYQD